MNKYFELEESFIAETLESGFNDPEYLLKKLEYPITVKNILLMRLTILHYDMLIAINDNDIDRIKDFYDEITSTVNELIQAIDDNTLYVEYNFEEVNHEQN